MLSFFWIVCGLFLFTNVPVCVSSEVANDINSSCPTWFHYNGTDCVCDCVSPRIRRVGMTIEISNGACASFSRQKSQYYAGGCPFQHSAHKKYSELPSDPEMLEEMMCGPYKRKGFLCGECIQGYGPAVYSYNLKCANCSEFSPQYAISVFVFLELVPGTVFFLCLVIFRLNITSGPLLGYVFFCQIYAYTLHEDTYLYELILLAVSRPVRMLFYVSLILSELWNLNFFKPIIPPFCISHLLTGVHVQIFSFITITYPVVLVIITCILMELHARNCRIIHILWKPFSIILNKTKITAVASDAVIHAFATIILLSATTVLYTLNTITRKSRVFQSSDCHLFKSVMFSDPTVTWFSPKHVSYVVLALIPFVLFLLIPSLLLCIYPTRLYRCLSRYLSPRKRLAITAFAEALHSCFKDGLNGTRDYRSFPGGLLLAGIVLPPLIHQVTRHLASEIGMGFTLTFVALLLAHMRPCKLAVATFSLSYHALVAGILSISLFLWRNYSLTNFSLLFIFVPVISHVLIFSWAGYRFSCWVLLRCNRVHSVSRIMDNVVAAGRRCYHGQRYSYQSLSDHI